MFVCPNILRTLRRTMIRFLIVRRIWFGPGLSVLTSLLVSVDVKLYWTMLRHWSQLVPNVNWHLRTLSNTTYILPIRFLLTNSFVGRSDPAHPALLQMVHIRWHGRNTMRTGAAWWSAFTKNWSCHSNCRVGTSAAQTVTTSRHWFQTSEKAILSFSECVCKAKSY